jgi:hypothetical protein
MARTIASSRERCDSLASSSATTSVSLDALVRDPSARSRAARLAVLVRLPLWPSASPPPVALVLKAGWAFSQREAPLVE